MLVDNSKASQCVAAGFYTGRIAKAIVAELQKKGSVMEFSDLEMHRTSLVAPIRTILDRLIL